MKGKAIISKILSSIGNMVVLSILWCICSIPIFTTGASSSSLYYGVVKTVRREKGNALTDFIRVFKENFWQALPFTMVALFYFTLLSFFAVQHFRVYGVKADFFICTLLGFAVLGVWFTSYAFPCISRFYFKGFKLIRFIIYISVKHLISTLLIIVAFLVSGLLCLSNGVFLMIIPALYNLSISFLLEPIFRDCSSDPDSYNYKIWYSDYSD